MVKWFFGVLADLFENWSDGSNDPGDLEKVAVSVAELVDGEFDDELDELLSKPFVPSALGFLASVLRKLS